MAKLSVCILGGTGFVGHPLAARLVSAGHRVKVLTRHRERHRDLLVLPGLSVVEADVFQPATLLQELGGCDAAINLVGILNERGRDGHGFHRAHVELPARLVDACHGAGVRRLLHMSALGADPVHGASHYQRTKGEGERLVHASGLQVTSFRPSVIFGPGDSFFNRFGALLRRTPGVFPLACAQARFQPVYVGDVAAAYVHALERHATFGQAYELCGPHVYTLQALVEYTAQVLHLHRYVIPLSPRISYWQARLLEHVPGKPFSLDNFHSLQRDNVCTGPWPAIFPWAPATVEGVVPGYLRRELGA
jgi:NADH dehydrogenase